MTNPNPMVNLWPLGAFLAAVGYCVWPYAAPEPTPVPPTPQLPKIDASWLKPTFTQEVARNPFLPSGAASAPLPEPESPGGTTTGNGSTTLTVSARNPASGTRAASTAAPPREPTPHFSLGATMVSGSRRAAIIDGLVYRQGERLNDDDGRSWTIDRVDPGRVLLGRPGRRDPLVLEMPGASTFLASGPGASDTNVNATGGMLGLGGLGMDLDMSTARMALAAAGVNLPMPDLMEHLARQSGGSLTGAYRSLIDLLISPPKPGVGITSGGESDR